MGLAIKNRESAAALVPIILRGPAEYIDKIKHFDFETSFSEQVPELRLAAIRRLALGMDVPPEILTGSADSNSWSAWQISSSAIQFHIIPFLQVIVSSLTHGWLRPALEALPLTEEQKAQIPKLAVYFDVSKLNIHQDTSGDAQALYTLFQIDDNALRQATGYREDDKPDDKELARQILLRLISSGQPELTMYAIDALRENFGLELLPKAEPPEEPGAAPVASGPGPAPKSPTSPVKGQVPGQRSQDKQTSAPPVPKIVDQSNNAEGKA